MRRLIVFILSLSLIIVACTSEESDNNANNQAQRFLTFGIEEEISELYTEPDTIFRLQFIQGDEFVEEAHIWTGLLLGEESLFISVKFKITSESKVVYAFFELSSQQSREIVAAPVGTYITLVYDVIRKNRQTIVDFSLDFKYPTN